MKKEPSEVTGCETAKTLSTAISSLAPRGREGWRSRKNAAITSSYTNETTRKSLCALAGGSVWEGPIIIELLQLLRLLRLDTHPFSRNLRHPSREITHLYLAMSLAGDPNTMTV